MTEKKWDGTGTGAGARSRVGDVDDEEDGWDVEIVVGLGSKWLSGDTGESVDGEREKGVEGNTGVGGADGYTLVTILIVPSALVGYKVTTLDAS